MNENIEMLNYIHKNAEMGQDSINKLLNIVDNSKFKTMLNGQFKEYKSIYDESEKLLKNYTTEIKNINPIQKIESNIMIDMKTLKDKSPSNISEMLIQGSTMGTIKMVKRLNQYKNKVDNNVYSLGKKLLRTEEHNIEDCKVFLG